MKTKLITSALLSFLFSWTFFAQDRTTVNAMNSDISDNLDLRAVASIFGESQNLDDFERRLNDPKLQISNLDLNYDNRVDYLRVIETVEGYTHVVTIQSVLGLDTFQDVATVEVEKAPNRPVSIQVVGDVYMYGPNYIYEPVYVSTPFIFSVFWAPTYHPYHSVWYWDYYPTYYYAWNPCPVYRYRTIIHPYINLNNHCNYVTVRRSQTAVALYAPRRSNYLEKQYPTRSFTYRNTNVRNRYELDQTRRTNNVSTRSATGYNTRSTRSDANVRTNGNVIRNQGPTVRSNSRENVGVRQPNVRTNSNSTRTDNNVRSTSGQERNSSRAESANRSNNVAIAQPNMGSVYSTGRDNNTTRGESSQRSNPVRDNSQRMQQSQRMNSNPTMQQNSNNSPRGNSAQRQAPQQNNRMASPQMQSHGRNADANGNAQRGGGRR
jgi:hypothetical protein